MIRSVKLDHLPEGIQFPEKVRDRIEYASDARELRFDGFMSKCDFDKLVRLSSDVNYQRALERLFQICTFTEGSPTQQKASPAIIASATAVAIAIGVTSFLMLW